MSDKNYLCESCKHNLFLYIKYIPVEVKCNSGKYIRYRIAKKKQCQDYKEMD